MKKFLIITIILSAIVLHGCNKSNTVSPSLVSSGLQNNSSISDTSSGTQNDILPTALTGNVVSGAILSGESYTVILTGHSLVYKHLFHITIPKNLLVWTNEYQSYEIFRLDFSKDFTPAAWFQGYFKVFVEPVVGWRKDINDQAKCTQGKYDEGVLAKKTTKIMIQGKPIYITISDSSFMQRKRSQGDLCFVENNIIYTVSVGSYDKPYIQKILNSFQFLN
ncbi:MAG: hypothetical protein NTX91_02865 [candidate division SR1 bacterium]|nr:hypothetical protein [candidate division SR1 bacterium]